MASTPRPEAPTALEVVAFDPYAAAVPLRWFRRVSGAWLLLLAPVLVGTLVAAAAAGGLLGRAGDFQPVRDVGRALGENDLTMADDFSFPLVRDTPVWILAATVVAQIVIVHAQWRLIAVSLAKLVANNVLRPLDGDRPAPRGAIWGRLAAYPPEQRLALYVRGVNQRNARRASAYTTVLLLVAFALAALLMVAERYSLFRALAPEGVSDGERQAWLARAYGSWWASTSNPVGAATYFLLTALVIYVILAQTQVGIQAARFAAVLPRLVQVDANWVNPDGDYGWGPARKVFRAVWVAMALYGLMVSVLAVVLGVGRFGWIPAAVWLVLLTFYVALPWLAFRRVEEIARERRIAAAMAEAQGMSTREEDELEARVARYRKTRIRPMRLGIGRIPVAVSVSLPFLLNVANVVQPFIMLR